MKIKSYFLILSLCVIISCVGPTPRKPVSVKTSSFLNESIERNKLINKQEEEVFKKIMELDSSRTYLNSQHGFWYTYNKKNEEDLKLPVRGDEIVYTYQISDADQNVLYSPEELGERTYFVDKEELIKGLQDGLKLMKEGEIMTFLFPSHLAYGYAGYKKIGVNQPLIYQVELKTIKHNKE